MYDRLIFYDPNKKIANSSPRFSAVHAKVSSRDQGDRYVRLGLLVFA